MCNMNTIYSISILFIYFFIEIFKQELLYVTEQLKH